MNFAKWIRLRFSGLAGAENRRKEFERELDSHLAEEEKEQAESGASAAAARYAARRALGNRTLVAEEVHEIWSWSGVERFARDLRYGARALRKSPAFTLVAVVTLALGIGANTAIFSLIDALMLQPLSLPDADKVVRIYSTKGGALLTGYGYPGGPSPVDIQDFSRRNHTFQQMVGYDTWRKNVSFGGAGSDPEQMRIGLVSAAYFEVLGVQPLMGRLFTHEENQPEGTLRQRSPSASGGTGSRATQQYSGEKLSSMTSHTRSWPSCRKRFRNGLKMRACVESAPYTFGLPFRLAMSGPKVSGGVAEMQRWDASGQG